MKLLVTFLSIAAAVIPIVAGFSVLRKWERWKGDKVEAQRKYDRSMELSTVEDEERAALSRELDALGTRIPAEERTARRASLKQMQHDRREREGVRSSVTFATDHAERVSGLSEFKEAPFQPVAEVWWGVSAVLLATISGLLATWLL
ncbi:MAG TPA: hypothetical protein VIP55_06280 [Agromyces sp.]